MTDSQPGAAGVAFDETISDEADASANSGANSEGSATPISSTANGHDDADADNAKAASKTGSRRIQISIRSLVAIGAFVILLAAAGSMTWLYLGERGKVEAQQRQASDYKHAEQIALDYAVSAATMNFQDLNTWKGKLVNGTTQSLNGKLTKAANSMQQILVPLEWNSTAQPLVAKVRSNTNGIYIVDTFVTVLTKTTQTPDNLQSTATYSITIDSSSNWQISDVGGINAIVQPK
ncbi:hypothetical protein [Mycobacteroides abscessus]|uniref:hypothetical protein n=1 Tax=Mycobacteroides abscessus TaxID=36809 RepID=UPI0009D20D99|nr:hypothetical protein [Mycobacteroides abscessus]SKU01432.1 Uncharacterised protein [Mycobacteroides abscessus subsp. massiliense]